MKFDNFNLVPFTSGNNDDNSSNDDFRFQDIPNPEFQKEHQVINLNGFIQIAYDIFKFTRAITKEDGDRYVISGIYRDGVLKFLQKRGYYKRYRNNKSYFFLLEENNIIEQVEISEIKDYVFSYIKSLSTLNFEYKGAKAIVPETQLREVFLKQSNLFFNDKFLEHLHNHKKPVIRDTANASYFFFQNTAVEVNKKNIKLIPYEELIDNCVWRNHIIGLPFIYNEDYFSCHFYQFIKNVSGNNDQLLGDKKTPDRKDSFESAIGYLLHNYQSKTQCQAVICNDEEITDLDSPQGGTGKGVLIQAISQARKLVKIDGKKFNGKDRFCFQEIDETTQVACFDDVKVNLGFDRFNSILTDGFNIEHKNKKAFIIPPEASPKVLISSNMILENSGSTRKRRQFVIEFSPHYSKQIINGTEQPILNEHGCEFFSDDWDRTEWKKFFTYLLICIKKYLQHGLINYSHVSLIKNQLKQTLNEDFFEYIINRPPEINKIYLTQEWHEDFLKLFGYDKSEFSQRSFSNQLKKYSKINSLNYIPSSSNGVSKFKLSQ